MTAEIRIPDPDGLIDQLLREGEPMIEAFAQAAVGQLPESRGREAIHQAACVIVAGLLRARRDGAAAH